MTAASLCLVAAAQVVAAIADPSPRPNVIFIARTPHLDALAARSLRFDHAYAQYPVCNPSRISMLTGLRPETFQIYDNRTPYRAKIPEALTLPRHFRDGGYHTVKVGKVFHDGPAFDDPRAWNEALVPDGAPGYEKGEGRRMLESERLVSMGGIGSAGRGTAGR